MDNTLILNNTQAGSYVQGISLVNSNFNSIECNKIYGTWPFGEMDNNPDVGMRIEKSVFNIISCNVATNISTGYKFIDYCFDGGSNPTIFRTNDIGNHYKGLHYMTKAMIVQLCIIK